MIQYDIGILIIEEKQIAVVGTWFLDISAVAGCYY
jgi:hypothetical protein